MPAAVLHIDLVFSRPETTLSVTRGAARLMADMGYAPLLEVGLPNGRRADVMALGPRGAAMAGGAAIWPGRASTAAIAVRASRRVSSARKT